MVCFYGQVAMNFGILRRILITLAFGNALVLSSFASNTPSTSMEHKQEISEISTKFYDHIKNSKQKLPKDHWALNEKYEVSINNILTETTNSMLDISPHEKSAQYSDGRAIPEFYEEEGFNPIDQYRLDNWNYVVLMNLLQNMRNGDITVIKNDGQKTKLLNEVVMDIRNAHIRKASHYNYDSTQYVDNLNKARNIIKEYFNILDLWEFVLQIKNDYYKPQIPAQENRTKIHMQRTKDSLPKGINNPGAFCYLIAALQCLYNSAPIRTAIQDLSKSQNNKLAKSINDIFIELKRNQNDKTTLVDLSNQYPKKNKLVLLASYIFQRNDNLGYQDPSEAIVIILDKLIDEEIKDGLELVNKKYNDSTYSPKKAQEEETLRANSKIGQICYFQQATVTICPECKDHSIKKDPPTTKLELPTVSQEQLKLPAKELDELLRKKHPPLQELIKWPEEEEKLEGTNNHLCEKCQKNKSALQRSVLCNLPKVLIIELERYFFYGKGEYRDAGAISCPNVLKIRQYKYRLRSFVYGGNFINGHIIMEGYADDGTPYIANDASVSETDALQNKEKAQMLVYELEE